MIAAAKGFEKSVRKLIRLGADFWNNEEFIKKQALFAG